MKNLVNRTALLSIPGRTEMLKIMGNVMVGAKQPHGYSASETMNASLVLEGR